MPVNLRRDPVLRVLSARGWDAYTSAALDAAEWERDGRYACTGKVSPGIAECIEKGALVLVESGLYEVYRWADLMPSKEDLEIRREEWRQKKQRQRRSKKVSPRDIRDVPPGHSGESQESPLPLSLTSTSNGSNGSHKPTSVARARDEVYEAFGEVWQGAWPGLPSEARGRINDALGSLRNMTENHGRADHELAEDLRRRWANGLAWHPEWDWTPQTLLRYWRKLDHPVAPPPPKASSVSDAQSVAEELEASGR